MLEGIRIIEVEGIGPGPFAGMTLADHGAEVIVVHRPWGRDTPGGQEQPLTDRGKKSIQLDLKDTADVETFLALVATADALIEGMRPGVMERLGIGPEICRKANPRLVYGRVTGWGQDGPLAKAAGHDLNYISMSGAAWYASNQGEAPFTPPTVVGDIGGGSLYLVIGLLSGILEARRTGKGCVVDAAIYDGTAHMMNLLMASRQSGNFSDERGLNLLDGPHWSRCYVCSDGGFISVQALEEKFYALFLEMLGLADDEGFKQQYDREAWPALTARLQEIFLTRTRDEWAELFLGSDACVAPVLTPSEAAGHGMNAARRAWVERDGVLQGAPAPRFDGAADWTPPPSPKRDEHGAELRAELANGPAKTKPKKGKSK